MATAFLTTRVGKCNEKDYTKLRRLVNYIHATKDEECLIGIEDIGIMHAHVDGSHAVHQNMRGHSGGALSFGIGLVTSASEKQKINIKSSTECEIVAVSDVLPKALCMMFHGNEKDCAPFSRLCLELVKRQNV